MFKKLKAFFNPEQFQGWGKKRNYFEGWYFKVVSADENKAFAIIPGIAMDTNGNGHAFIQVLDGKKKTAVYHRFDATDFNPFEKQFKISIRQNSFSESAIRLDLPDIKGELRFAGNVPWPKPWYSPGIMGPYAFVPFMECYHGIVSMDHRITGTLLLNDKEINFDNGRGYIEKDWGRSFRSAYFWMQAITLFQPRISIKGSVSRMAWMRDSLDWVIGVVSLHNRWIRCIIFNV